jgi:Zn-dependent protease
MEFGFWGVYGNILLMVFNLIPIPPLDGFTILLGILPAELAIQLEPLRRYGSLAIIVIIFILPRVLPAFDIFGLLITPAIDFFYPLLTGLPF